MTELKKNNKKQIMKIWDLPIRVFHWALVICIFTSWLTVEIDEMELHVISGACILGLLTFRLLWGVIGPFTAQFHNFISSPYTIFKYLRNPVSNQFRHLIGHSPIGSLSVIALLLVVSFQVLTGLFADDEIYLTGPLAKFVDSDMRSWSTKLHAQNFNILFGLIILHVVAILFYLIIKKNNLVGPMITGNKTMENGRSSIQARHPIIVLIVAGVSILIPYYIFYII